VKIKQEGPRIELPELKRRASQGASILLLTAAALNACGHVATAPYYATCMDNYGHIVPASYCSQPGFWYYMSSLNYYGPGYYVGPGGFYAPYGSTTVVQFNQTQINNFRTSGSLVADNDRAGRSKIGLSPDGNVAGSKITSNKGGFDGARSSNGKAISPAAKSAGNGGAKGGSGHGSSGHGSAGG
jgi:hypothetical protein